MKRTFLLLLALALCLPLFTAQKAALAQDRGGVGQLAGPLGFDPIASDRLRVLERASVPENAAQVRVERRVVIRISPSSNATRTRLVAELPRRQMRTQFQEAEYGDCIASDQIAGVQPMGDDRLLLITRDRQLLTASLDRACNAQAFYSGFYIERSDDGQLCVRRDHLQSRAGDSCQVAGFSRLVAVRE